MERLSLTMDFTVWKMRTLPTLEKESKKTEISTLDLLPTVLNDTLCLVFGDWRSTNPDGSLKDALQYLETWCLAQVDSGEALKKFMSRRWQAGEAIEDFAHDLRRLAVPLALSDTDRAFKVQLIAGLPSAAQPFIRMCLKDKWPSTPVLVAKTKTLGIQPDVVLMNTIATKIICQLCNRIGHSAAACNMGRRRDTAQPQCFKCGSWGHVQRWCKAQRPHPMGPLLPVRLTDCGVSCTMKVSVSGVCVVSLVDTGSPRSFIWKKSVILRSHKLLTLETPQRFFGIGGSPFDVTQFINCCIVYPGGQIIFPLLVTQESPTELILGVDFLQAIKAQLDFSNGAVAVIRTVENPVIVHGTVEAVENQQSDNIGDKNVNSRLQAQFPDVFACNPYDIGKTSLTAHDIETSDNVPFKVAPYRTPWSERELVATEVKELLRHGIIRPSKSPWASPYLMVSKKGHSKKRFCIDFRRLNSITRKDTFPIPRIDDCLDLLGNAKYFSTIDLASGYWQVPLTERSKCKTAFIADGSLYEFNVMPFGLCNAPGTFQRLMKKLLNPCKEFTMAYLDDVIIFSKTAEEHSVHLEEVMRCMKAAGLKLRPEKCHFWVQTFDFLGYEITPTGVRPTTEKLDALKNFTRPLNKKSVKRFLGFTSFYRRFVHRYAELAAPLDHLARPKTTFQWTEACENAFQKIVAKIASAQTLSLVREDLDFQLHTDASGVALGAVLSQMQPDGSSRPVYFASRKLNEAEQRYSTIDREALALSWGLKYFRVYLLGRHVDVFTDHKPLLGLLTTSHITERQFRLLEPLALFKYTPHYLPGKDNVIADALSRDVLVTAAIMPQGTLECRIREEQLKDEQLRETIRLLGQETVVKAESNFLKFVKKNDTRFTIALGALLCDSKLVVPSTMTTEVMQTFHSNGHFDAKRTLAQISQRFWWYRLSTDVHKFVQKCLTCATSKSSGGMKSTHGSLPAPGPFELLFVDLVGPLPQCRGYSYLLTMEDSFTRWVEAVPLTSITSEAVSAALVKHWIFRFGPPVSVHSDQGMQFESDLFANLCATFGMRKTRTTPYHPQGNGALERFHRTLKERLITANSNKDWVTNLSPALFAYRTVPHSTTSMTPFQLTFGFTPQILQDWPTAFSGNTKGYVQQLRSYWDMVTCRQGEPGLARKPLHVGDLVFIRVPVVSKLEKPWSGPFRVIEIKGPTTVDVETKGIVHINRLKYFGAGAASSPEEGEGC